MKYILLLGFTFWCTALPAQQSCDYFEERMKTIIKSEFSISDAEELFDEYVSLDCANMLLAYNFIGFAHYNTSNLLKAKEFLIRGEDEFFDKEIKPEQFSINQMYTALVLIVEKDFETALYHLKKAENFAKKSSDKFIQSSVLQNIGMVKIQMGDLEEGEEFFKKAIDNGGLGDHDIGYIYQNLALLHLKNDNYDKLEEYIKKTKTIWNDLNHSKGKYLLSFIESGYAINTKKFKEALSFLNDGRAAYETNNKLLLGQYYLLEAEIHDSLGNMQAKLIALENAIIESTDLSEEQLNKTISSLSDIQDDSKTNIVLAELVSKLKLQTLSQNKISVARNKIMDTETAEDESLIKTQLKYLFLLGGFLLLLSYLLIRIRKQNLAIQYLNESLESSKKEIETQLHVSKQKNKELEQFAYVASHDLKSPLRTISSFADLLKRQNLTEKSNKYLDFIINSSKNMGELITELLNYSTLDQSIIKTKVNLSELIHDTLSIIRNQVEEAKAVVNIEDNCNRTIACDSSLFGSVIQNLVANAILYCKNDQVPQINISTKQSDNNLLITVSDNGIGIPESCQDTVFEMFKRLKSNDAEGTGIGLASCKKIIEKHGGKISVKSIEGKGSDFIIEIPNK